MADKKKDVLQPVDEAARRLAKTLLRTARYGALGTLEQSDGAPAVSRVSLATAMNGDPVFLISQLSGHFGNLEADARCSLLVGEPGKGDPLAHPRMTLIGQAERVPDYEEERGLIKSRYLMRHPKAALYVDFADFAFWRVRITRASLNAGFGRAYALGGDDVATAVAGLAALADMETGAIKHTNDDHAEAVARYAQLAGAEGVGWRISGIDPEGLDLARSDETARLWFDEPLKSAADLRPVLVTLARRQNPRG